MPRRAPASPIELTIVRARAGGGGVWGRAGLGAHATPSRRTCCTHSVKKMSVRSAPVLTSKLRKSEFGLKYLIASSTMSSSSSVIGAGPRAFVRNGSSAHPHAASAWRVWGAARARDGQRERAILGQRRALTPSSLALEW